MRTNEFRKIAYNRLVALIKGARDDTSRMPPFPIRSTTLSDSIGFENTAFTIPADKPSITIAIRHTPSQQVAFGGPEGENSLYEMLGTMFIHVNTPLGGNMSDADDIAQVIMDGFFYKRIEGVKFENVYAGEVGEVNGINRITVQADFEYDRVGRDIG